MKPTVYADNRETASGLPEMLKKECIVIIKTLDIADYVLSEDVAVERKTAEDFVNSLVDGRLFDQIDRLKQAYSKPLLVIEGNPGYLGRLHENAIRGALSHIMLTSGVPVYFSRNLSDTSKTLALIARREQLELNKPVKAKQGKKAVTLKDYQRMVIESLPGIGPKLAVELLERFGNVQEVLNADVKQLMTVPGLGKKKAEEIRRVLNEQYRA